MTEKKKAKRKHLHQVRSVAADDGSIVHHHTYMGADGHPEPERIAATSENADDAGTHTADNFGQNAPQADPGAADPSEGDPAAGGGDPSAAAPAAGV